MIVVYEIKPIKSSRTQITYITLLDDDDSEVITHVEQKILGIGAPIIPLLEETGGAELNPKLQERIESILHALRFDLLKNRLIEWHANEQDNLLKGLWILATYQYPNLTYEDLTQKLEQCYFDVRVAFQNVEDPIDQIERLNSIFFDKLAFKVNKRDRELADSMINQVLETKKGNSTTLFAVYMLIAQKLKLPVYGVNLPNLSFLIYQYPEMTFYINVPDGGMVLHRFHVDYYYYLNEIRGVEQELYQPCSNLEIFKRAICELMIYFLFAQQHDGVKDMVTLLNIL